MKGATTLQVVNPGSFHDEKRVMRAGETLELTMYSHWTDDDLLPHDWSVTAWASDKPVTIEYLNPNGSRKSSAKFEVQSLYATEDDGGFTLFASIAASTLITLFI